MRIAILTRPNDGCCYYRLVLPIDYMPWDKNDVVRMFYPNNYIVEDKDKTFCGNMQEIDFFNPDIVFFHRNLVNKDLAWLLQQKQKGVKIIIDIDDLWDLGFTHPMYSYWNKYNFKKLIEDTIKLADLVLTTNERLRKIILEFNTNCEVIPNALPFGDKDFKKEESSRPEKINFLYAGGSTHFPDISLLKNKFERIGSDTSIKGRAVFTLAGYNPLKDRHCEWDKMASIFKRTNSYQILDTRPLQVHMSFYDQADVVLVPLQKTQFSQYKSILKIIEAATRELPCIVSNVPPYSDLKDYPGIFWEDWIKNIKLSINSPIFVKDQGKLLAERMKKEYDLRYWAKVRYEIFKNLLK